MEVAMLEPSILPPVCPACGRTFVSWPSVSRHLRLDHTPEREEEGLTVAEILAARADDEPPAGQIPHPTLNRTGDEGVLTKALNYATRPWLLAIVVWLGVLYGLSHLGFGVAHLVAWSFVAAVLAGAIALQVWARAELHSQEFRRKDDR
jgi:hypothetical protein